MSKKLISVTLALVLCLSLFLPGLAVRADESATDTAVTDTTGTTKTGTTDTVKTGTTDTVSNDTTDTVNNDTTDTVNNDTTDTVNNDTTDTVNNDTTDTVNSDTTDTVNNDTTDTVNKDTADTADTTGTVQPSFYDKLMACKGYREMKALMADQAACKLLNADQTASVQKKLDGLRTLFDKFMECKSLEEMKALEAATPKEELDKLTKEQQDQIRAWADSLKAAQKAAEKTVSDDPIVDQTKDPGKDQPLDPDNKQPLDPDNNQPLDPDKEPADGKDPDPDLSDEDSQLTEEEKAVLALYDQFMACQTYEEMAALRDTLTEEQILAFSPEQTEAINAKAEALAPETSQNEAPKDAAVPQEPEDQEITQDSSFDPFAKDMTDAARVYQVTQPQAVPTVYRAAPFATFGLPMDEPQVGDGVEVMKYARDNQDGSFTITLEAYATGDKIIDEVTKTSPTDMVLVLDQSGSMNDPFKGDGYARYNGDERQNQKLYQLRHNPETISSNLYYKMEDNSYVSVNVEREPMGNTAVNYVRIDPENTQNGPGIFSHVANYWSIQDNLYAKVGGEYVKVTVKRTSESFLSPYEYTYTFGGQTIKSSGSGNKPELSSVEDGCFYQMEGSADDYRYTYSYRLEGVDTVIAVSEGNSHELGQTEGEPSLYKKGPSSGSGNKLAALKNALTSFSNSVAVRSMGPDGKPGTSDDVNHRIAMVGFASKSGYGNNTELFYTTNRGSVSSQSYNNIENSTYSKAFQSMNTSSGQNAVSSMIGMLTANGATRSDLGMEIAQKVLEKNPVTEERKRVVILFTDGAPTEADGFSRTVAKNTIDLANALKGTKTTVYTVGIFDGANAESAGKDPGWDLSQPSGKPGKKFIDACNWYMQQTSSNNGVVSNPSYYMSASNADSLDDIFKSIVENVESGGSSTTLDARAVIKDVVTPYFVMKPGSDVTLSTEKCIGVDPVTGYIWQKNPDALGASAAVGSKEDPVTGLPLDTLSVTGFNFSENYVGTVTENGQVSYRGNKLVISFDVLPRDGFLGGNQVPTNVTADLYETAYSTKPLKTFEVPTVDVPLADIRVGAADGVVFVKGTPDPEALKTRSTAAAGGLMLDLSRSDFGIPEGERWKDDYASLSLSAEAPTNMTADDSYDLTVTLTPTRRGTYDPVSRTDSGLIRVAMPTTEWQDSEINGGVTPDYETQNLVSVTWATVTEPVTVITEDSEEIVDSRGSKYPVLTYEFDPAEAPVTTDTPVKVQVKLGRDNITDYTTFKHKTCLVHNCQWEDIKDQGYRFIVHINTFDLVIKKGVDGTHDSDDTFIFRIEGPSGYLMDVVLKGGSMLTVKGLPAGSYTITEITDWSTGYEPEASIVRVGPENVSNGTANAIFINLLKDVPLTGSASIDNRWYIPSTEAR